jgi:hypothetical protein
LFGFDDPPQGRKGHDELKTEDCNALFSNHIHRVPQLHRNGNQFGMRRAFIKALATDEPKQDFPRFNKEHSNEGKYQCKVGDPGGDSVGWNGRYLHGGQSSARFGG